MTYKYSRIHKQIRAFIQRKAMAQIESLAGGKRGGEQMSAIMFAIKNICGTVDDLVEDVEGRSKEPVECSSFTTGTSKVINLRETCCSGPISSGSSFVAACKSETTDVLLASLRGSAQCMQEAIAANERNRLLSESILNFLRTTETQITSPTYD